MKKIYLFACATLLAFSSCTNEINEDGFVDKTNAISFSAYPTRTRAVTGDVSTTNMKGDNFGVVGYRSNDKKIYLYKGTNSAVEQTWKADVGNVPDGGSWEYKDQSELKFWPSGSMDFYAYFPYSDDVTFKNNNKTDDEDGDNVMTIDNVTCSHDILFAKESTGYKERVPLTFYHAFSKIKKVNVSIGDNADRGYVKDAGVSVEIQKVEFINTSTSGTVKVDNEGYASYEVASTNKTLSKDLSNVVTVHSTQLTGTLIDNSASGGYLFATTSRSTQTNNVKGTGKIMWNGTTSWAEEGTTLETLGQVCLKLTCKVWNGTEDNKYYYLGDNANYGDMYIPLTGTSADPDDVRTFEAGKRYIYNIVFKDNVGFKNNGDPVLRPILFHVASVDAWTDVTVTITL